MRTGADYLKSLNDGRQVFVEGERVKDVTAHPAFREAARSVARLYDIAADPANRELMTFTSPKTGQPALRAFQIPRMRDEHLYLSYAIVPPQIDRSKPAHQQSDPTLHAGVMKDRDDGIVIKGAQQVATGGVLSDWVHLSCIHPMPAGDENYANCVAIPINAPGVKLFPRRPYALRATKNSTGARRSW